MAGPPHPLEPMARDLIMLAIGGLLYGLLTAATRREWVAALVIVLVLLVALAIRLTRI